jgi:hypothetical protein
VDHRRRAIRVALHASWLAAAVPHVLYGQTSHGRVEIGAARLSQRNVPRTDAVTAGATFRHDGLRYAFAAAGGVTLADEGRSTSQGLIAASLLGRPGGRTRWELGGALTTFAQGDQPLTAGAYLVAREYFTVGGLTGWAGVGVGGVEEASRWNPTRTAEVASWFGTRGTRITAAVVLVDTQSEPYDSEGQIVTDPVTYTDASLGTRWAFRRRVELDVRGGLRLISRGALTATGRGTRPFAAVDAAVWLTPRVAVVAGIGRQLSDLARGTPDTRFASLGLRFTVHDRATPPGPTRRPSTITDRPRLALVSDTAGQPRIFVTAPRGAVIEIAASFTGWEPIALVRRGDGWELDRAIPSGAHRVLVRVDGGPWLVPANLPTAADDFGGSVGIITIP